MDDTSRRDMFKLAAGAAAAAAVLGSATAAQAYQGNMERALSALYDALASLREATDDKGGHKAKAAQLVEQAIAETQQGIAYGNEHP